MAARAHRRWPWLAAAGVVVVLVAVVVLAYRGRSPEQASVDEAVDQFRAGTTMVPVVGDTRPPAGVYTATGSGTERLSIQAAEQPIGPTLPVTVTHQGTDCFVVRVDYNTNHWQTWTYCLGGGELTDTGGQVFQRFDFVVVAPETLSTSTCDPAVVLREGMVAGDRWEQRCTVTGGESGETVTAGPHVVVARETRDVGGVAVDTWHTRDERTYGGSQTGASTVDTWFDAATGLPVHVAWDLRVDSDSPLGTVTYSERGEWTLDSLAPRS